MNNRADPEIRRNVVLLAATMAMSWAVVQLIAALAAVTLKSLTGRPALAGLAPGLFLVSWAFASIGVGWIMDRRGRAPGLRLSFAVGVVGALVAYSGAREASTVVFMSGIALIGACCGGINLARAGAADMYPPETRARGISYVLVGAAAGAILSPLAYAPILHAARGGSIVSTPWLAAGALLAIGALITFGIRVDPMRLAEARGGAAVPEDGGRTRPLIELLRQPGVWPALYAAAIAQAVMSSFMTIIGISMVDHGQSLVSVTVTMSAHFIGMFGLVLVVGRVVEWIGRQQAMAYGLATLTSGLLILSLGSALPIVIAGMFVIGVGWNIAFVASTAVLADAAHPAERAELLGLNDLTAIGLAAPGVVSAAVLLGGAGMTTLVVAGAAVALTPLVPLTVHRAALRAPAQP